MSFSIGIVVAADEEVVQHRQEHADAGFRRSTSLGFTSDGRLLSAGTTGLRLWNLEDGTSQTIFPCTDREVYFVASVVGRRVLLGAFEPENRQGSVPRFFDLDARESFELRSHGDRVIAVALDPTGKIAATGGYDGLVQVGPVTGEEPHLLLGHRLQVDSVAVSPGGKWIASGSQDGTIRLWPVPQGQPPHALPYEELLEKLRSLTNLRVVADEKADTGYRLEAGRFPGWKTCAIVVRTDRSFGSARRCSSGLVAGS